MGPVKPAQDVTTNDQLRRLSVKTENLREVAARQPKAEHLWRPTLRPTLKLKLSVFFLDVLTCVFYQFGYPQVYVGPEGFNQVRKACRNNFHLISCNMDSVVTSYDPKTKHINDYFNVSVSVR